MADAQRVIELVFRGVDETAAATRAALDNTERFSASLRDATQPIADFTVGALKLEAGLLATGAALTAFAVKVAGDFDSSFREISTLVDRPVADLDRFRAAILSYASTSTAPLEQVTTAIYNAISAGVPLEQSLGAVAQAERLAVAGKADLNDTLRVLVSSLNAYGDGMDQAGRYSDALFTTVKQGQTTLPELAASLANVTGAAAAVGVPFETLLAAVSTLTAAGTPTAQAVTQINAVLTSLLKPSKDASDLARELGIEFSAQAVKAKGLEVVLAEVAVATGGNEQQMARLFGSTEALKAAFPLTGAAAEKFRGDLEAMRTSAGATDEAFGKMAEGMQQVTQKVSNQLTALLTSIGTPLLDEFRGMAGAVAAIFQALGASVNETGFGGLVQYVESIFADVQATLERVATNLPAALAKADLSGFREGLEAVVRAVQSLFGGIDLSSVDGLTRAIELAGAAFLGLSKYAAGVIESFKPLFDLLVRMASQVDGVDMGIVQFAGNLGGIATQVNLVAGAVGGMVPYFETLLGLLVARQGMGLVGAVGSLTPALASTAAALAGPAGVAIAVGAAAYKIGELVSVLLEWKAAQDNVDESQARLSEQTGKLNQRLAELSTQLQLPIESYEQFDALVRDGVIVWDEAAQAWARAGDAAGALASETGKSWEEIDRQNQALLKAAAAADQAADSERGLADERTAGTDVLRQQGEAQRKAAEEAALAMEKAAEARMRWNLEMAKLDSAETIKLIEAQTAVSTARIEADAQRIKAAYESLGVSIQSTGELLGDLYGELTKSDLSWSQSRAIEDGIQAEEQRRKEAFEMQKQLTEAEIELVRERTAALQRGDALITVDGAGLQPHLEAFMWELLKAIQVRVNQDGLEMLVGA